MNRQKIQRLLHIAMSDDDIRNQLGDVRIVKYGDLDDYDSIDDVLSNHNMVVILVETMINNGHWICALKYGHTVEIFDSYGLPIDDGLRYINLRQRKRLDELVPELSLLLDKCPYRVIYNKKDLQKWDPDIKTCGRHVCLRLKMRNLNLPQYIKWITEQSKKLNLSSDEVVCYYIQ